MTSTTLFLFSFHSFSCSFLSAFFSMPPFLLLILIFILSTLLSFYVSLLSPICYFLLLSIPLFLLLLSSHFLTFFSLLLSLSCPVLLSKCVYSTFSALFPQLLSSPLLYPFKSSSSAPVSSTILCSSLLSSRFFPISSRLPLFLVSFYLMFSLFLLSYSYLFSFCFYPQKLLSHLFVPFLSLPCNSFSCLLSCVIPFSSPNSSTFPFLI